MIKLKDLLSESGNDDIDIFRILRDKIKDLKFHQKEKQARLLITQLHLPDNVDLNAEFDEYNLVHFNTRVPTHAEDENKKEFKVNPEWLFERLRKILKSIKLGFDADNEEQNKKIIPDIPNSKITLDNYGTGYWTVAFEFNLNTKITPKFIIEMNDKINAALKDIDDNNDLSKLKIG